MNGLLRDSNMNAMDIDEEKRKRRSKFLALRWVFCISVPVGRLPHFGSLAAVARASLRSGWALARVDVLVVWIGCQLPPTAPLQGTRPIF